MSSEAENTRGCARTASFHSARVYGATTLLLSSVAHAQSMGQGLFSWATPFILFIIAAGMIIGLVMSFVMPQNLGRVVWGLAIAVAIFAVIHNIGALLAAVQQG